MPDHSYEIFMHRGWSGDDQDNDKDWNIFISVILSFFNKKRVLDIHVKSWSNVLPGEQVSTNISWVDE